MNDVRNAVAFIFSDELAPTFLQALRPLWNWREGMAEIDRVLDWNTIRELFIAKSRTSPFAPFAFAAGRWQLVLLSQANARMAIGAFRRVLGSESVHVALRLKQERA